MSIGDHRTGQGRQRAKARAVALSRADQVGSAIFATGLLALSLLTLLLMRP